MYLSVLFVVLGVFVNFSVGTNSTDTLRVVGGSPIPDGELPNLVYLQVLKTIRDGSAVGAYTCSGTLINAGLYPELFPRVTTEFFVITAAHCVVEDDAPYQVSSKVNILWSPDSKVISNMKFVDVGKIIIHPEYNSYVVTKNQTGDIVGYSSVWWNDLAIIEVFIEGEDDWVKKMIKVDFTKDISDFPADANYVQAGYGLITGNTLPDKGFWYTKARVNSHTTTITKYNKNYADVKNIFVDRLISNNRFKIVESVSDISYAAGGDSGGALWSSDTKTLLGVTSTVSLLPYNKGYNTYTTISFFLEFIKTVVDQMIPLKSYSLSYSEDCNNTISVRVIPDYIEDYFSNKGVMTPYLDYVTFSDAESEFTDYTPSRYLPDYSNPKLFGTSMYIPISQSPSAFDYVECLKNGGKFPDKCVKKLVKYQESSFKSDDFLVDMILKATYNVFKNQAFFDTCRQAAPIGQYLKNNDNKIKTCTFLPIYPGCSTFVPEYKKQLDLFNQLATLLKPLLDADPNACMLKRVMWIRNNGFQTSRNSYYEYCNVIPLTAEYPVVGTLIPDPLICIQYLTYP